MLQQSPDLAGRLSEWFRNDAGRRRLAAIGIAVVLEALLLWLLLSSLGIVDSPKGEQSALVSFDVSEAPEAAPEPAETPESQVQPDVRPAPRPSESPPPPTPTAPQAAPTQPPAIAIVRPQAPVAPTGRRPIQPVSPDAPMYGPADTGAPASTDSVRVGTAPDGEPLYAARWYREPYADELRGYLSTATGPGWGLIACQTAPDYRVENCVAIDESPRGSMINRAVLAAAWQFKVRPPRLGGRSLVGAWVRIRIDYDLKPAPR